MKMSMDIDPQLLDHVKAFTQEKAQATAVNKALADWVRLQKVRKLRSMVEDQPFEFIHSASELRAMNQRSSDKKK